jgi:hypothetical protein
VRNCWVEKHKITPEAVRINKAPLSFSAMEFSLGSATETACWDPKNGILPV